MDNRKSKILFLSAAAAGALGFFLRMALYRTGVDEKGLLIRLHPLTVCVLALSLAMLAFAAICAFREKKQLCGAPTGKIQAAGSLCMGIALLYTVLSGGPLPVLVQTLGIVSALAVGIAAWFEWQQKQPSFLTHGIPCAFLGLYLVNRYQLWSQNPQLADYVLSLLGLVVLMLYTYQMAAGNLYQCSRRSWLFMGTFGTFCLLAGASGGSCGILCLGGGIWMLTGLWSGTTEGAEQS